MRNIIFIAPPAAGKGSFSNMLKEKYGYIHISTGDMLREAINSGSDLGGKVKNIIDQGKLVSDDIMVELIATKLTDIKGKPFILDGFPRTLNQAVSLDKLTKDFIVIYLDIDEIVAERRIEGRYVCSCGRSYNVNNQEFMPKVAGICDDCGKKLIKRKDDNIESYKVRYETFIENAKPLSDYYKNQNKLFVIDVNRDTIEVLNDIIGVIND
jgi:adenylate kinase